MHILVAQINPIIADLNGNAKKIIESIDRARSQSVDLVIFPELALTGYPPQDFLLMPHFEKDVCYYLDTIIAETKGIAVVLGTPRKDPDACGRSLRNSAAIIHNQVLIGFADKLLLPNYDVFDEKRYFESGKQVKIWIFKGLRIAITICEDLWGRSEKVEGIYYEKDPISDLKSEKLDCVINLSASPFSTTKLINRFKVFSNVSEQLNCPVIVCNQVGANDNLIFDGYSFCVHPKKGITHCAKGFCEEDLLIDLSQNRPLQLHFNEMQDLYEALILGIKDYFSKLNFQKACLGLSGGIDSAVVACLSVKALGPEHTFGLIMPSQYSSMASARDAHQLAKMLGIQRKEFSITSLFDLYRSELADFFEEKPLQLTEENLQARIRGMILMAFSNQYGYLVLNTGNKSEFALGYSTLYGDMCGALSVIGDLTKTQVYALAHWINREEEIIPWNTILRPPSAELHPNQKDSDTIPDYQIVDTILKAYLEDLHSVEWIASNFQYPIKMVEDLIHRIHLNEYKRHQAPFALRVSEKSFSFGRRFPIVEQWKG